MNIINAIDAGAMMPLRRSFVNRTPSSVAIAIAAANGRFDDCQP